MVGRECLKSLAVNKLMYGCRALVWSQNYLKNDLEVKLNEMGRWICDVVNVKNELIIGETAWSIFEDKLF